MAKVENYFSSIYKIHQIKDFYALGEVEDRMLETADFEIARQLSNQFILLADEEGISYYELMAGIKADKTSEDLEFRRERLLRWITMNVAYTLRFLRNQLDSICGKENYTIKQDYDGYTLFVDTVLDPLQFKTLRVLFTKIMPCNIAWKLGRTILTQLEEEKMRAVLKTVSKKRRIGDVEPYRNNANREYRAILSKRSKKTIIRG